MITPSRHFVHGVALTALLATLALWLARLPGMVHLGGLSIALILGLGLRAVQPPHAALYAGIGFSAKSLLRLGILLLGVRLNLDLVLRAGPQVLGMAVFVITVGLLGISWLGRRLGLDPVLAGLIAVDSSICGGSAAAAAAPVLRAKEDDVALVIPLCSLIGTTAMLGFTFLQHHRAVSPQLYGMITGATLQEVAQVMAAVGPFPESAEIGTIMKLTRVLLLIPALLALGWVFARRRQRSPDHTDGLSPAVSIPKPWFVLGFLLVGTGNSAALQLFPEGAAAIATGDRVVLMAANFLLAMAMAGMGLQMDFARLRANGLRAVGTAVLGWLVLAGLTIGTILLLNQGARTV